MMDERNPPPRPTWLEAEQVMDMGPWWYRMILLAAAARGTHCTNA